MPQHLRNIRPLYLLALFQLVGGPLVLLSVILFSRLSVTHVAEHGLTQGFSEAWQSDAWQSAMKLVLEDAAGVPVNSKGKVPARPKEIKPKFFAVELEKPLQAPRSEVTGLVPWVRSDRTASARSHAPPAPPPRWV